MVRHSRRGVLAIFLGIIVGCAVTFVAPPQILAESHKAVALHSSEKHGEEASASQASSRLVAAAAIAGVLATQARTTRRASETASKAETGQEVSVEEVSVGVDGTGTAVARDWSQTAIRRMWTRADSWHVHAISGAIHTLIGFVYLVDVIIGDLVRLNGGDWTDHVSFEWVLISMVFGAVNAVSGLQPTLLPQPTKNVAQLLGFGEDGNLQAAGFVNTAGFYFFLTYQYAISLSQSCNMWHRMHCRSLRVLPEYPAWLQPLDPILSATAFVSIFHAIFLINSWVSRGKMSQALAIGISAPLLLNVPVSLHLTLQGQWWVQELSRAYPGWPDVFFSSNYALAWAGSMVTLVLSLYERKVCDLTQRALMTVFLGVICFTVIPLRAKLLVPQWFGDDWPVMLTLNPPSA
ncbi:unnamed protein product [Symbiodinium pilosum]|uniref:Uncharacterized protein n=1 Tax=Symbiodinium pilosum TaxID=2952 RepID=A0A812TMY3_SYMPI|nr:unnamed protein product [Symbiodinium pilosum]